MALDADGILYVATPNSPGGGAIWEIDTDAADAEATILYPAAGSANGLTVGPDGAVYYSDFQGDQVYRVDSSGSRTTVTTTAIDSANGVLFDPDGTLLVLSYSSGDVLRLTLDVDHEETDRDVVVDGGEIDTGSPDGLARDELGRHYVTDNGGGRVLRFDPAWTDAEPLLDGVGSAANMAFGRGALACDDLYVTSSGAMRRIAAGASGVP
jgi:sugar lactone lactonase YvrE